MNYFELFGLIPSFKPDLARLKKSYYKLSFQFHPDHQASTDHIDQDELLAQFSYLNKAYNTLKDENKLFEYILQLHDVMPEEGKAQIPQEFLMEMMDLNEELMELEFETDIEKVRLLTLQVESLGESLYKQIENIINEYEMETITIDSLNKLVDYYMKKKYLLRIKQNLL
ncbi:MAG TPA: Fe-S protein assembly co-chaperone HscB, partial [Saprospiraceae bacterium]|nr:Fe-S protein assembly co-chaperone HscB [Saprospiraceae bacterium]